MVSGLAYRIAGFILLGGFPVAMLMAWMYDYDNGVIRTPVATPEELSAIIRAPRLARWSAGALGLGGVFLLGVSGLYALASHRPEIHWTQQHPIVAVLPFVIRSPDPADVHFAEGLHDDVLVQLSSRQPLGVISRTSAVRLRDTDLPLSVIANSLGASAVLEGAVQRSGDTVRVTMQLIDARTDEHLWAAHWDERLTPSGVLLLQRILADSIAEAVDRALTGRNGSVGQKNGRARQPPA
jgi:TolB-like protein